MNRKKKGLKAILALLLTLALVIGMVPTSVFAEATPNATRVADTETRDDYKTFLGDNNSTRYAGRVWTDKSVSTGDVQFTGDVGSVTVQNDSDFLVTYSALATSQEITQLPKIPVDVVFILDFSASMTWTTDGTTVGQNDGSDSRIKAMVDALNQTIAALAEDNPHNRIGIVTFNRIGSVFLPLTTLSSDNLNNITDGQYLELDSFTVENDGDGRATIRCNIDNGNISNTRETDSKTNIQFGLSEGMRMLSEESTTTYTYSDDNGFTGTYTRIPNVVLMSDGAPTTISLATDGSDSGRDRHIGSWWSELSSDGNDSISWGDNYQAWSANGFMPLLTASYFKNAITNHYSDNYNGNLNPDQAQARVYTIGFSTNEQTQQMSDLANIVLNPTDNLDAAQNYDAQGVTGGWNDHNREQIRGIYEAWRDYQGTGQVRVNYVTESYENRGDYVGDQKLQEVTGTIRLDKATGENNPTSLYYNDAYFSAENADDLNNAFQQITSAITESAKAPTEVTGGDPVNSGYITYTDTIGDYMEIDAMKTLIWAGEEFNQVSSNESNGVTTYTFTKEDGSTSIDSPVYGQHDVNHIIVQVDSSSGRDVLTVKIPANSIPLRVNYVEVNADGTVASNINNGALPLRLCYTVGLKQEIRDAIDSATGILDLEKITDTTLKSQLEGLKDTNGNLTFYSNLYDANKQQHGTDAAGNEVTIGDATVEFTPADDNPFYFIQEDMPLYTDEACEHRATSFDASQTYYFKIAYYDTKDANGNLYGTEDAPITKLTESVIARPGSLLAGYVGGQDEQQLYIKAGAPRLGNLQDFTKNKEIINDDGTTMPNNITGTAQTYFYPEFIQDGDTVQDGHFLVHLGNNGKLTVPTQQQTGSITITKTDGAGEPLEGAGFTLFEVTTDPATGEVTNSTPVDLDLNDSIAPGAGTDGKYPYEKTTSYYQAIAIENPETDQNYNSSTNRYIVANSDGSTAEYIVHRDEDNNKLYYYVPIEENDIKDNMTIVAMVEFSNLDISKTYQFVETTRPNGYIQNTDGTSGAITLPVNGVYDIQYEVVNHRNISLPSSGLGGVTTLLMIGAVLVVAGAGYLILRKRKVN